MLVTALVWADFKKKLLTCNYPDESLQEYEQSKMPEKWGRLKWNKDKLTNLKSYKLLNI